MSDEQTDKQTTNTTESPQPEKMTVAEQVIDIRHPKCDVEGLKLNIGSGVDKLDGYINIDKYDSSADANFDIFHLPFANNSIAQIVAYQVFEHLSRKEGALALAEWHRVLKPNGNVVMTIPSIEDVCKKVLEDPNNEWMLAHMFGNQDHEGQFHKWGYTPKSIFRVLAFAGFRVVHSALFGGANGEFPIIQIWVEGIK
jgi:predicted SAM-dependent methyltransferase